MGHSCCSKQKVKRGLWSPEEDEKLVKHITTYGHGSWSSVPKLAGLQRCGKSCRLRWINYLRPDLKRGSFTAQEEQIIIDVHRILGNRWAQIAKHLPGRTDNEVKNFWNSCIKKKLISQGLDPKTHNLIPSHQRHNINKVISSSFPKSHQQPFSIISLNSQKTHSTSMEMFSPPVLTPPHNIQPSSSSLPTDQNPNINNSIIFPSSSSSSANPSAEFSQLLDENCFWANDCNYATMEPFEGSREEVEQAQQQQLNHAKEKMEEDIVDMEAAFDSSSFGLELMESALFSASVSCHELHTMDDLAWNF